MSATEIKAKVQYFESLDLHSMSGEERARTHQGMIEFYDSLDPSRKIAKYAAGGALAAGVLPGIGWIAGGLIGAGVAAFRDSHVEVDARQRMKKLIDRVE